MLKFKISGERFAEAANTLEYLTITNGRNRDVAIRMLPRFLLDENNEYIVKIKLDDDGDILEFENQTDALMKMTVITPNRLGKLADELMEAAKAIVNPQTGGG